jgi:hypothetical protein
MCTKPVLGKGRAVDRRERLALNESLFRETNERLAETAAEWGFTSGGLDLLCECADVDCTERIDVGPREYERARSEPTLFLLKPGHDQPQVEEILEENERFVLVRKLGEAGDVAAETDPRR